MRFIIVIHYHYDCTEPVDANGTEEDPMPSYATYEEAQARIDALDGPKRDYYIWAVAV